MKVTLCVCALFIVGISLGTDIRKEIPLVAEAKTDAAVENGDSDSSSSVSRSSGSSSRSEDNREHGSDTGESVKSESGDKETLSENDNNSAGKFKDGTYTGTGKGFKSQIKVQVTVSSGEISDIKVLEGGDDPEYFNRAQGLLDDIIKNQSTDVDVVSGATFSSNGLIQAVNDALSSGGN